VEALARVPGLGKKTAQRLVLELKGKLVLKEEEPLTQEAVLAKEALRNLGYSANEVKGLLREIVSDSEKSAEEIVKEVLRKLGSAS
jgi:Holliday junction DNA helicase RuvA